ncbi:MAG: hypothetical protein LBS96_09935 [Oscillospiraceae bacterium]|jgi:hypothetical protein|nr:hypothetical protein [Oscillospiraceae bacterium]
MKKRNTTAALAILAFLLASLLFGCTPTSIPPDPSSTTEKGVQEYRAEKDGLELTVLLPPVVQAGKEFTLTATVRNLSDADVVYVLPSSSPDMHFEIRVTIAENGKKFMDVDTFGVSFDEALKIATLEAGGQFAETVRFLPGWLIDSSFGVVYDKITWFPAGTYEGVATFFWGEDCENAVLVTFPVVIQ